MADQRLDAAWLTRWSQQVARSADVLRASFEQVHGYPPGGNEVVPADDATRADAAELEEYQPLPGSLRAFYSVVASVSLADVDNGQFIHDPSLVLDHLREYGQLEISENQSAVVFASDGGGHLLAIDPTGRVHKSTTASWAAEFDSEASDLRDYLEQLRRALEQAVIGVQPQNF